MAQQYGSSENITVTLEGPFGSGGAAVKLTRIHLSKDGWKGAQSPYSQTVAVEGISIGSMVDLQPAATQLQAFHEMDIAFTAENEEGIVTVYAIGDKPLEDIEFQASLVEVVA